MDATILAADEAGLPLFLVGGSLRDLLLERPTLDIDLVVEGNAAALARRAADALGARCIVHPAFSTAAVKGHGYAFDLAMARSETYARPGALPRVRPAAIGDDLARRDFTINAMALALTGPARGQIVDPSGGQVDLRQGLVRVLYDGSFVDDATRILRALRYEARLGFRIEAHTLGLLRGDVGYLETIGGARLRRELLRLLEESPLRALLRAQELGVLKAIHPSLGFDAALADAFALARRETRVEPLPSVYLALLASRWSPQVASDIASRLALTKAQRLLVEAMPRLRSLEPRLAAAEARPSELTEDLSSFPAPAVWALAFVAPQPAARDRARRYLEDWRYVKTSLDGTALLRLGIAEGPAVGEVMRRLRAAKLDGEISTRQEELAFVRGVVAGVAPTGRGGRETR